MLTLCHVNLARGFRGGERQTELLVRGLAARGWTQAVVARRGEALAERLIGLQGVELRPVGAGALGAALALGGARLVHVHQGRAAHAAWLRRVAGGAPYLITRRVPNPPGRGFLTRCVYRRAERIVVLSEAIGEVMQAHVPEVPRRCIPSALAHLPADPERVAALRARWAGCIVAGHVGALVDRHKGQRVLIEAARRLAAVHPEIRFVLLGCGEDEAALRAAAEGLASVEFEGQRAEVGDYLAAFDLFVFPSRDEGLGSALLDAMDHGLPAVASRVGGIPEIVAESGCALLVPPGDAAALSEAVARLASDPELRATMGRAARLRSQAFSPERMVASYEELYRELLGVEAGAEPY